MSIQKLIKNLAFTLIILGAVSFIISFFVDNVGKGLIPLIIGMILFLVNQKLNIEIKKDLRLLTLVVGTMCFLFLVLTYSYLTTGGELSYKLFILLFVTIFFIFVNQKLVKKYVLQYLRNKAK